MNTHLHFFIKIFKGFINSPLIVLILLFFLFLSLQLISSATVDSKLFGKIYYSLLTINIITLILLFALITKQSYRLYSDYKNQVAGSKLTLRMVITFVILVILPTTILYSFSLQFIQRSIDGWFDATVETALEDAMNLSKSIVSDKKKFHLRQVKRLVQEIELNSSVMTVLTLSEIREKSGAEEVTLLSDKGKLIATTSDVGGDIVPNKPGMELLLPLQQGHDHVHVDLDKEGSKNIRVLVRINLNPRSKFLVLQAFFPLNDRQRKMAASVQQAYTEYSELVYLRTPLKDSFILTLSLVLFLGLFSTIWAAFVFAKRLASPIKDLSAGTRAVAEGNYHQPIPLLDTGDLGQLVESFNQMTRTLAKTHKQLEESHIYSESQRAYLEAILSNLTSGVLSIDKDMKIQTINDEAEQILNINKTDYLGFHIKDISLKNEFLQPLIDKIIVFLDTNQERWQEEVTLDKDLNNRILVIRGNLLPDKGCVIVLEDVTTLLKAQKDAAWGEVARRLAHEIKNPLTPIQLSAERINLKFSRQMEAQDKETLQRLTGTIINQVDNMKSLVKSFSEYARLPSLSILPIQIDSLILEVVEMYNNMKALEITTQFKIHDQHVHADAGKIRQVLHNLIKNSIEAMENDDNKQILITILPDQNSQFLRIMLEDNGEGIKENIIANIFEPYVTEKSKGSGLGLAIVRKIIEEHGGQINAENIYKNDMITGSRFILSLPLVKNPD
ncbi:MAG: HAMP domain-containing protein [Gammaproteobacteria bacterium]|nr:HAMP domain-containing protein [Gammaproteobacteria bacterium]